VLLFAHTRFGQLAPDAPSTLSLRFGRPRATLLLPAWRRLSAPWMLTLRVPSFHIGTGRAFTKNDPTSDAPLSLSSTGASAPISDCQL